MSDELIKKENTWNYPHLISLRFEALPLEVRHLIAGSLGLDFPRRDPEDHMEFSLQAASKGKLRALWCMVGQYYSNMEEYPFESSGEKEDSVASGSGCARRRRHLRLTIAVITD